jgi:hypothetical protein
MKPSVWPAGAGLLLLASTVAGQERTEAERPGLPQVHVQMVIGRGSGENKAGPLVYSFPCNPRDRKTVVKSGIEVPVPVRKADGVEFQYRNVGANIECESAAVAGGRFSLRISVERSSLVGARETMAAGERTLETLAANPPVFRTSMSQFTALLRDGQKAQVIAGSDPVTGEATTVDLTLTVLK